MGFDEAGVRRRGQTVVAVLVAIVCALTLPGVAVAAPQEFTVNSIGDESDAAPGLDGCLTAGGGCTLRAAIEEANQNANEPGQFDTVTFDEVTFGGPGATIVLADSLPAIVESIYVKGTRECESGGSKPCVGISGPIGEAALTVQGTSNVEIEWLAVTDAEVGIAVEDSTSVKVFGSWFGVGVDGSGGPNQTGVLYGPGSDGGVIGRPAEGEGNLFANSSAVGLDLFGASNTEIVGNWFGVKPNGSSPAPNGEDIEVTSDATGGIEAVGNEIGGRVKAELLAGPCDQFCNLISGATGAGLDLRGDGGAEGPAVGTLVLGNYFGLTADGAGSVPNAGAAIRVGAAAATVIGAAKAADANRFSGGAAAIDAGPGAPDLVVRGNHVGVDGFGHRAPAPAQGIKVDSSGLTSPADEAILAGNELRMGGGTGILQEGFGAWIVGNEISGAAMGIQTRGGGAAQGNVIERNSVTASALDAILLENGLNDVVGNLVFGAGGAGIAVRGEPFLAVDDNLIGGDSADEENAIVGASRSAIEIENAENSITTVARNLGSANGGLFIDLLPADLSEPNDPNGGIAPPSILGATSVGVSGTAQPGATVRVFRKQTATAGEIEGFLGAVTADEEGGWALLYGVALPPGTAIAASQTSAEGGTSELALASLGSEGGGGVGGGGQAGGGGGGSSDGKRPRTAILGGPKARSSSASVRFRFASDELGTTFQCKFDRRPFRTCRSPQRFRGLRPGKHVFAVRAVDAAGNVDASPATRTFTVVAK